MKNNIVTITIEGNETQVVEKVNASLNITFEEFYNQFGIISGGKLLD